MLAAAGTGLFPAADSPRRESSATVLSPGPDIADPHVPDAGTVAASAAAPPAGNPPSGTHRLLRIALIASLAAHGLLFAAGGGWQGRAGEGGGADADRLSRTWLNARLAPAALPAPAPSPMPVTAPAPQPLARAAAAPPVPAETPAPTPAAEPEPAAPTVHSEEGFAPLPAELPAQENIVYFKPSELDEGAVPIASIDPQPDRAPPGVVTIRLRLYISATGYVDKVDVLAVAPETFPTDFAVSAFKQGRFDPAKIAAVPVASQKTVELTFAPG